MISLDSLNPGVAVVGVEPSDVVTLVAVVQIGDGAVQAIYKTSHEARKDRLLPRVDEAGISTATLEPAWSRGSWGWLTRTPLRSASTERGHR
jgi:hypothetical protein